MVSNTVNIKSLCEEFIKNGSDDMIQKVLVKLIKFFLY